MIELRWKVERIEVWPERGNTPMIETERTLEYRYLNPQPASHAWTPWRKVLEEYVDVP